jgi:hypothetical protein
MPAGMESERRTGFEFGFASIAKKSALLRVSVCW